MALGRDKNPFLLREGNLFVSVANDPTQIGISDVHPDAYFDFIEVGYFKMGSTKWNQPVKFAEARVSTPSIIIRKDMIQQDWGFEMDSFQFNISNIELIRGLYTIKNKVIATPTSMLVDMAFVGSDRPTPPFYTYKIESSLTDGTPLKAYFWYVQNTTEDLTLALSGTEHAVQKLKGEGFPHPSFGTSTADTWKHYGLIMLEK